jgi:predicted kinase
VRGVLVIVSGPPGAGKTTLAKRLGREVGLAVLSRDDIKDAMFESLGWSDREWSIRIGRASYELLYLFAERLLEAKRSVVLETNFDRAFSQSRIGEMQSRMSFDVLEINCSTDPTVLARRFRDRWNAGGRHPGHTDVFTDEDEFLAALSDRDFAPATLGDNLVQLDTTDFEQIDWNDVIARVRKTLGETRGTEDG